MIEDEKYLIAYFGNQSNYYLDIYKAHYTGNKFTFNIGAFLAGLFWFLYRKLFVQFFYALIILFACSLMAQISYRLFTLNVDTQKIVEFIITAATATIFGFIGNYLYIKNADKNIQKILNSTKDEELRLALLSHKGGISYIPFLVIAIIIFLLTFLNNHGGLKWEE